MDGPMALKALRTPMRTLRREIWNAANRRPRFWLPVAAALGVAAALSLMLWGLSDPLARFQLHAGNFRLWILSFGALAPLIYTGAFSLQILLAPVPGNFMGLMGGYLFGAALGTLYSVAGLTVGAGLAMLIARRFGRPLLERFFSPARLAHWEKKLRVRSPVTWWLIFFFPVPDLAFYAAGLTSAPLRLLLAAVLTGRGLSLFLANFFGSWTTRLSPEWLMVRWTLVAVMALLIYWQQRRIRLHFLLAVRRGRRWMRRRRRSPVSAPRTAAD